MVEDTIYTGFVHATTSTGGPLRYSLSAAPTNGTAFVDTTTGAFTYTPKPDFFGSDTFQFQATDGHLQSKPATVAIQIANVNDRPVLFAIGDMTNSPESLTSTFGLQIVDVDGDALRISATSYDEGVAIVDEDEVARSITITPVERGKTRIQISVSDAEFTSQQEFAFEVRDVTKSRVIDAEMIAGNMLTLTNSLTRPTTITLEHNGFPMFQSHEEIVDFVKNLAPVYENEPFQRKLWRFVRNNVYHHVPLTTSDWLHDPWAVINSQGWGFCSHASSVFVHVARAAGYEARIWGLDGHVVPEINIDGRWSAFDPDLAVYYLNRNLQVASVEELAANPALITEPINPIFANTNYDFPYSTVIAGIYETSSDNFNADQLFITSSPSLFQPLVLPPGAKFTYPGRWTKSVVGVDGTTPVEIPYYLQGKLTVPAGDDNSVVMPWILWEIRGSGRVRLDGSEYNIGSGDLQRAIQQPQKQITEVEVVQSSTDIEFIFFINAMRYGLSGSNTVRVTGKDVWAVNIERRDSLESEDVKNSNSPSGESFAKPRPPSANIVPAAP